MAAPMKLFRKMGLLPLSARYVVPRCPRALSSPLFSGCLSKTPAIVTVQSRTFHQILRHSLNSNSSSTSSLSSLLFSRFSVPRIQTMAGPVHVRYVSKTPLDKYRDRTLLIYVSAVGIFMIGAAYAGVPLYRMFCQATGLGGQAVAGHDTTKISDMAPVKERTILVKFNADTASSMQWSFRPQQPEITVLPGETALAFYSAKNPTDKPIIGISTYNVVPFEAGQYFNKIQCFCFEEQRLNPHEKVDMPVFFYIDPEFAEDPKLETCEQITLSYTFFEAKEGMTLPLPGYMQQPVPH